MIIVDEVNKSIIESVCCLVLKEMVLTVLSMRTDERVWFCA